MTKNMRHIIHMDVRSALGWFSPSLNYVNLSVHDLYNVFTADTLRHAVTLTFDRLTLNICVVLAVTCSNSISNVSEIEHSAAKL